MPSLGMFAFKNDHCICKTLTSQRLHQVGELTRAAGDDSFVHSLRFQALLPGVLKGRDLRGGFLAALFLEEHVVAGVGVEGRIKVNQVNAGVRDVVAKDVQIIAKIELICSFHLGRAYHNLCAGCISMRTARAPEVGGGASRSAPTEACGIGDRGGSRTAPTGRPPPELPTPNRKLESQPADY